nr:hypothetical protein [uncultured Porphyromonas sp.]
MKQEELSLIESYEKVEERQYLSWVDQQSRVLDNEHKAEDLERKKQDRDQRKTFALRIFVLLCVYLLVVGILLALSGFSCIPFSLSDTVLITLLGTSCANVIALFIIVTEYLFPRK